ncbi:MAG: hypothetical protein ABIZ70_02895 [Gemmatimonadales bacterium]
MTNRIRAALVAAVLVVGTTASAQAQTHRSHFGPRLSYNFDAKAVGIGAQLSVPVAHHLEFYPSLDVFFVDAGSLLGINADIKYRVGKADISWLYVGTGLNISRRSVEGLSHSDAGLNLFLGAESLKGKVHPFGEMRFTVADGSTAALAAGLNFTL